MISGEAERVVSFMLIEIRIGGDAIDMLIFGCFNRDHRLLKRFNIIFRALRGVWIRRLGIYRDVYDVGCLAWLDGRRPRIDPRPFRCRRIGILLWLRMQQTWRGRRQIRRKRMQQVMGRLGVWHHANLTFEGFWMVN